MIGIARDERLLTRMRRILRMRHYSRRTEGVYLGWVRRYVEYHRMQHPRGLAEPEVADFLSLLAVDGAVGAGTQNQALAAILFLYRHVLGVSLSLGRHVAHARRARRLPVVLTRDEVWRVLAHLDGPTRVAALLMYGSGLRLMECLTLRVKDLDFADQEVTVRGGKGNKDRRTMMPRSVVPELEAQLRRARRLFQLDVKGGCPGVPLPDALAAAARSPSSRPASYWIRRQVNSGALDGRTDLQANDRSLECRGASRPTRSQASP